MKEQHSQHRTIRHVCDCKRHRITETYSLFLDTILKDINNSDMCYIRSLQQIIKYKQLLIKFIIKHVVDDIHL